MIFIDFSILVNKLQSSDNLTYQKKKKKRVQIIFSKKKRKEALDFLFCFKSLI